MMKEKMITMKRISKMKLRKRKLILLDSKIKKFPQFKKAKKINVETTLLQQ
jgi:hypothetical protein